jgi:hypothetical protein
MGTLARLARVKKIGVCFHCLAGRHYTNVCKTEPSKKCGVDGCLVLHHALLHPDDKNKAKSSSENEPAGNCARCNERHWLKDCPEFNQLSRSQRNALARRLSLCYKCLRPRHPDRFCGVDPPDQEPGTEEKQTKPETEGNGTKPETEGNGPEMENPPASDMEGDRAQPENAAVPEMEGSLTVLEMQENRAKPVTEKTLVNLGGGIDNIDDPAETSSALEHVEVQVKNDESIV